MSATIPVPLHPPKTLSSDPLKDKPTSYAPPQHLRKELDTVYTTSLRNVHPTDRVKRIMDSVKQKLENHNKLTLEHFNRQLKSTTPSFTTSFPFHPTTTKKIRKSLESHDMKVTSLQGCRNDFLHGGGGKF